MKGVLKMKDLYIYNVGTHTLHIKGFCANAKGLPNDPNYKLFENEDEAIKFARRGLRMCELCSKERDEILAKNLPTK